MRPLVPSPLPGCRRCGRFVATCPRGPAPHTRQTQRHFCCSCSAASRSRLGTARGAGPPRPWRIGGWVAAAGRAVSAPGRLRGRTERVRASRDPHPVGPQARARPEAPSTPTPRPSPAPETALPSPRPTAGSTRPFPATPRCGLPAHAGQGSVGWVGRGTDRGDPAGWGGGSWGPFSCGLIQCPGALVIDAPLMVLNPAGTRDPKY